jgi:hypothetical protein
LATTRRTAFGVATWNVKFAFDDATVVAGSSISAPILGLVSIAHTIVLFAVNYDRRNFLRFLNPLWPALDHAGATIDNEFLLGHENA